MATFKLSTSPQSQSIILLLFLLVITDFDSGSVLVKGVDDYNRADFPTDFVFGAGTSAYQVEGAALEDGRTRSIFDTFALGYSDNDGDIASDGYHKYKEDVQLMVDTGLEAFRFSISWSRLIPNGTGPINPKGLQFYNNFINELISKGIQPHVTICHSDLPQVLEDKYGGWLSRRSVKDFTAYADVCFKKFGDRVSYWTTINEANIFVFGGYDQGLTQPARCSSPFGVRNCSAGNSTYEPYIAAHNILLSHASAARLYEKKYKEKQHGYIGLNLFAFGFVPHTNTMEDVIATQRAQDFFHGWFANPLVFGDYPESMKKNAGTRIPAFTEEESKRVKGSFDFLAVNHYMTLQIKDKSSNLQTDNRDFESDMAAEMKFDVGDTPPDQYPSNPPGLQGVLEYFKQSYGNPPIYVHENGQRMKRDSQLNDTPRVEYLHGYIGSVLDAIRNGSNTRGYFYWSFMDVYELLFSYNSTFGLYYVDREDKDLTRYPKLSAHWFLNPLVFGDYPEIMKKNAGSRILNITKRISRLVKGSFDFIVVNHYYTMTIKDRPISLQIDDRDLKADMEAEIVQYKEQYLDACLQAALDYIKDNYGNPPIYIYENGLHMKRDGKLDDIARVEYLQNFIGVVLNAIRN